MSRRLGACPCAWRRKPLWARGRDRARAQLTRECDTPTMGAPRQGVNSATLCAAPSTGAAHTVSATAAKRPAPARGRCMPSPVGVSGAVHSRGATDRAPMLWSGPRPRPIAWRAHCGRAGHPPRGVRPSTLGAPPPATTTHPSKPLVAHSRRQRRRDAVDNQGRRHTGSPPALSGGGGGSVATTSDRHVVRIVPRCRPRRCGRSSGRGVPCGTSGIPLSGLWSHRE